MATMRKSDIKILYVDDEDAWRVVFQKNLRGNYEVITARNAEEGWELLKKHSDEIAVIVSDQRMPGRPGIELLKQAKAYFPKIVRIIATGFSDSTIAVHATNQGAVYHYISKPWETDDLNSVVGRAVDFYMLRQERDHLLERKLSTIQRKNLESKMQCLLIFGVTLQGQLHRSMEALQCYLDSIQLDPGEILNTRSVYKQSQSELQHLLLNLNYIKELNQLQPDAFETGIEAIDSVGLQNILLYIRDNCSHVIYSSRSSAKDKPGGMTVVEEFLATQFLQLVQCWICEDNDNKLIEISESNSENPDWENRCFRVRICKYTDPNPLMPDSEDPLFNGVNLPEAHEMAWLKFLFLVHHLGGNINPLHLSKERLVFEISDFKIGMEGKISPDQIIAELVQKFESWNYTETVSEGDETLID